MLVLSRKVGEKIVIGNNVVIEVLEVRGYSVRLGIVTPPSVPIFRTEILPVVKPTEADQRGDV